MHSATPSGHILSLQSRRLDSHQHEPVYKTGAFLCRATSASTSARSRTPSASFGDWLLSQEHTRIGPRARRPVGAHLQPSSGTFQYVSLINFDQLSIRIVCRA
jgi:hypothetical protein